MIPVIVTLITGDAISAGDMIASVPIFLLESHYSRGFEMEADQYALEMMLEHGMNPDDLADILEKLGNHYHEDGEGREDSPDYLSSHPAIMERVQHARALGLTQK